MKNLILLLTMCLVAKFSFAASVQHPTIDDDLDYKMESNFQESERGVANFEKEEVKNEEDVPASSNDEDKQESLEGDERGVASDEEVFDSTNENGIRYWKY